MSKNRLYSFICIACFMGFCYLFYSVYVSDANYGTCIIKNVTGIPCPSCGTTRAVLLLLQGDLIGSLLMNPFGILVTLLMFAAPIWIIYDCIAKKESFYVFYKKSEAAINTRGLALLLILLVLLNWIWNIVKQL